MFLESLLLCPDWPVKERGTLLSGQFMWGTINYPAEREDRETILARITPVLGHSDWLKRS